MTTWALRPQDIAPWPAPFPSWIPHIDRYVVFLEDTMRLTSPSSLADRIFVGLVGALSCSLLYSRIGPATSHARLPRPVTPAAEQDHQNMMKQLGIRALRPGPGGNEKAPNHANYDESKGNPFPELPDPLKLTELSTHTCSERADTLLLEQPE